jgi:hypothetical protein
MQLDPNVSNRYMYIVKEDGTITYAPQQMMGPLETVKHTDLAENGPARCSGELNYDPATREWVMDNNSGRYSWDQTPDGRFVSTRSPENLDSAAQLARDSGTTAPIRTNYVER